MKDDDKLSILEHAVSLGVAIVTVACFIRLALWIIGVRL